MKLSINAACERVRDWGRDGNEHLIALRPAGLTLRDGGSDGEDDLVLFTKDGDKRSVSLGTEIECKMFGKGDILVHNHPNSLSGLSCQDTKAAAQTGTTIYAITQDGSRYWAKVPDAGKLGQAGDDVHDRFSTLSDCVFFTGALSRQAAEQGFQHVLHLRLAKAGLIDYGFNLKPESQKLFEEFVKVGLA